MASTRILILSDNTLAELLQALLERANFQVHVKVADSEQEALCCLQEEHFHLLILPEILPSHDWGYNFLAKCRPKVKTDLLTLMISGGSKYNGFVRAPAYQNQAHAYIPSPFLPKDFLERVTKLLAGASTQDMLGDEGYIKYENQELGVTFSHPAFWEVGFWWYPETIETFQCSSIAVWGPLNRNQSICSSITVAKYSSLKSVDRLLIEDIMAYESSRRKGIRQVMQECEVQVAGIWGKETEYVWPAENTPTHRHSMWRQEGEKGKVIKTVVRRKKKVYVLSVTAAEEEFEDFRPVYAQLLETFEFLE